MRENPRLRWHFSVRLLHWLTVIALAVAPTVVAARSGPEEAFARYRYPYPSAPDCDEQRNLACARDMWSMLQGQCTSWVAFRVNQVSRMPHAEGHVAYVERVETATEIVISEMNYDGDNGFRVVTVHLGYPGWPTAFIHIADR